MSGRGLDGRGCDSPLSKGQARERHEVAPRRPRSEALSSRTLALLPPIPLQGEFAEAVAAAPGAGASGGYEHEKLWHSNATWAAAMTLLGGEHAAMGGVHPATAAVLAPVLADPEAYAVAGRSEGPPQGPLEPEVVAHRD